MQNNHRIKVLWGDQWDGRWTDDYFYEINLHFIDEDTFWIDPKEIYNGDMSHHTIYIKEQNDDTI
ncbi:hypothetical protein AGMMS50268_39570 [Spirochaetia bacterium]|nr:hypothetical protein AGMMS50268_39570 [Spirochaetia bacterium]